MRLKLALLAPLLLLTPADAQAATTSSGPCYAIEIVVGDQRGARSVCPPQTWTHWHQVHVRCSYIAEYTESGPMTGGTGVSQALCPSSHIVRRFWNTQGPDHP
ncbi:hypothetical protein ACIBEJ_39875 [Nonomuraea sp. NPDC050790]|uniref:hypothetical protein n=1 Tax=Nonomuraea sp. NPDC050790 TaxID=3364371 RepID=UPI0037A26533